jgi:hypothetical protein
MTTHQKPETKLQRAVLRLLRANSDGDITGTAGDVLQYGCQSGTIVALIYTRDCIRFYRRHQAEIDALLADLVHDTGEPPHRLFKDWDEDDPLARDDYNLNLLAWFGFEETTRQLFPDL